MKIVDLAKAIAPSIPIYESGIRPGEKIHEQMITSEDARRTLEYDDYYIIQPDASWWISRKGYVVGGRPVPPDFSYNSGTNTDWLTVEEMCQLIGDLDAE